MTGDNFLISVENLHIKFGGAAPVTAVNNLSFQLRKGETLAIVGESGSGKSLTALALMGLLPNAATISGNITLNVNEHVYSLAALTDKSQWQSLRGKEMGMIFQEPMTSLNPIMCVGKQLEEAIFAHQNVSKHQAKKLTLDWLQKVQLQHPEETYKRYPHQLSGGQKQRIMIAMAMCNHPSLLIADEPTTSLDVTIQHEIIQLMSYLQHEHNSAMIFITHDLSLAAAIADDTLVMYKGELMEYGETSQVLAKPQNPYTKALLACKPSRTEKGKRLPVISDFLDIPEIPQAPLPERTHLNEEVSLHEPILSVNNLQVWFAGQKNILGTPQNHFKAVNDVSFTLYKGEVLGLVGESGSGKSTLSRCLMGLTPVNDGAIIFDGRDISKLSPREWKPVRRRIQMIFQDPYSSLNPRMTIGDAIMEAMLAHNIVEKAALQKETYRLLDLVNLSADSFHRYPHQFSGGQRQRVGIARTLALKPQILLCDEIVSALDVSVQAQILNLLKDLQAELKLSYLFISHDLSIIHYISDRVMVMKAGKIIESGEAEEVFTKLQNEYTRQLIDATVK